MPYRLDMVLCLCNVSCCVRCEPVWHCLGDEMAVGRSLVTLSLTPRLPSRCYHVVHRSLADVEERVQGRGNALRNTCMV